MNMNVYKISMIVELLTFDEIYNETFYQIEQFETRARARKYFANIKRIYAYKVNSMELRRLLVDFLREKRMVPSPFILELLKYFDANPPAPPNYLSKDNYYKNLSNDILSNIAIQRNVYNVGTLADTLYQLDRDNPEWIDKPPFFSHAHLLAYLSTFGFIFDDNFVEYLVP